MDSGQVSGDSWPPGDVCECQSTTIDDPEQEKKKQHNNKFITTLNSRVSWDL